MAVARSSRTGCDVLRLDQQLRRVCQGHHLLALSVRAGGAEHAVEDQSERRRRRLHEGGHLKLTPPCPGALTDQHLFRGVAAVDGEPQVGLWPASRAAARSTTRSPSTSNATGPPVISIWCCDQPEPHLVGGQAVARAGIAANEKLLVFRVDKEDAAGADGIASQIDHPAERLSAGRRCRWRCLPVYVRA